MPTNRALRSLALFMLAAGSFGAQCDGPPPVGLDARAADRFEIAVTEPGAYAPLRLRLSTSGSEPELNVSFNCSGLSWRDGTIAIQDAGGAPLESTYRFNSGDGVCDGGLGWPDGEAGAPAAGAGGVGSSAAGAGEAGAAAGAGEAGAAAGGGGGGGAGQSGAPLPSTRCLSTASNWHLRPEQKGAYCQQEGAAHRGCDLEMQVVITVHPSAFADGPPPAVWCEWSARLENADRRSPDRPRLEIVR
jgi:hypothetical protein